MGGRAMPREISVNCAQPETKCDQRGATPLAGAPAERGRGLPLSSPGRARPLHRRLRLVRRKALDHSRLRRQRTRPMRSSPATLRAQLALAAQGFALLRFTNAEVFHNLEGVLETIRLKLIELRPRIEDLPPELARSSSCPSAWGIAALALSRRTAFRLRIRASGASLIGVARPPILSFPHHRASGRTPVFRRAMGGRDASDGSPRPSPTNGCVNRVAP